MKKEHIAPLRPKAFEKCILEKSRELPLTSLQVVMFLILFLLRFSGE